MGYPVGVGILWANNGAITEEERGRRLSLPAKNPGKAELPQPKPEEYDIRLRPDQSRAVF